MGRLSRWSVKCSCSCHRHHCAAAPSLTLPRCSWAAPHVHSVISCLLEIHPSTPKATDVMWCGGLTFPSGRRDRGIWAATLICMCLNPHVDFFRSFTAEAAHAHTKRSCNTRAAGSQASKLTHAVLPACWHQARPPAQALVPLAGSNPP